MINFQNKRRFKKSLGSPIFTLILILVLVFLFESGYSIFEKKQDTSNRHDLVASQLHNIESEREFLETEIEYMQTDRGKEEEVRKQFGVAEEGELMAVIVDSEENEGDFISSEPKRGLWAKILDFFR